MKNSSKIMETSVDIDDSCRVCLKNILLEKRKCIKVQETPEIYKDTTYQEIFETVTGHSVNLQSEPHKLCFSCAERLLQAFELRKICDKTQKYLQSRVSEVMIVKSEEINVKVEVFEPELELKEEQSVSSSDENDRKPVEKRHKCDRCGRRFARLTQYRAHYKSKHPEAKVHSCPHCSDKMFEPFLEPHKKRCRKRPRPTRSELRCQEPKVLCPICGVFRRKEHVQIHINRVSIVDNNGDIIKRPFTCDLCGRKTATRDSMFIHMQIRHLRVKRKCKHCKAEFKNRGQLETHMRKIHPEIKGLLECKVCEYRTLYPKSMHFHLKKHTGKDLFRCEICKFETVTKAQWVNHMSSHSDERPFACETCNATFKTKKALSSHRKRHLPNDYECPVCTQTYQTAHLLRNHVTKSHPEYQLPPPGTVLSKSWRERMAEQEMSQGVTNQKGIEEVVVQEPPPIETKQYFQVFYC